MTLKKMKKFFIKLIKGILISFLKATSFLINYFDTFLNNRLQRGNWYFFIWSLRVTRWGLSIITALGVPSFFHWFNTGRTPARLREDFFFLKNSGSENFSVSGVEVLFGGVLIMGFISAESILTYSMLFFLERFDLLKKKTEKILGYLLLIFNGLIILRVLFLIPFLYAFWFLFISGMIVSIVLFVKTSNFEKRFAQSFPGKKFPKGIIERDDEYTQLKLSKGETIIRRSSDGFVSDLNILWEARERVAYYENDDERLHEIRSRKMMKVLEKILRQLKELKELKTPKSPRKKSSPGKRGGKS